MADLFFSEYIEGSSNNKALEIYNGTGSAVDLAAENYVIQMYFNGSITAGLTINLTGTVAHGDVFVLANGSANASILAQADQTNSFSGWFNGDDAIVLRKGGTNGTIVDSIGQIGFDPGTEWGIGLISTADNTLRRKSSITSGDNNSSNAFDPSNEWDGFATDTFDGLGSHTIAEVAGITLTTSGTPVDSNGGGIAIGDLIVFTFAIANIGNDPTQFRIPNLATTTGPGVVSGVLPNDKNGSTPLSGQLQYSTDNGATWTNISGIEIFTPSVAVNGTVLARVPVTVQAGAQNGDIITVTLGNTPGNSQNQLRSPDGGDVYTVDNPDGTNGEISGAPTNGMREASATGQITINNSKNYALATILKTRTNYNNGNTPANITDDTLTYDLALRVESNDPTGQGITPTPLISTNINVDGVAQNYILVSDAIPGGTDLKGAPIPPPGWQAVYTTDAVTTKANASNWKTFPLKGADTLGSITRIGFINPNPIAPGQIVNGFSVQLGIEATATSPLTVANISQVFGKTSSTNTPVYDDSGDQNPSNYQGNPGSMTPLAGTDMNGDGIPDTLPSSSIDDGYINNPTNPEIGTDTNNNNTGSGTGGEANTFTLTAASQPDLSITLADFPDPVTAGTGNILTYTLTATNNGNVNAAGVNVNFTLPAGVKLINTTQSSGFNRIGNSGTISFTGGNINPGSSVVLTANVEIYNAGTLTSGTAVIDPNNTIAESDETNNTAAAITTTVNPGQPDLSAGISTPGPLTVGTPFNYTLDVQNNGGANANGIELNFTLPANVTYNSSNIFGGGFASPTINGSTLTFTGGSINAGNFAQINVNVTPTKAGTLGGTTLFADPNNNIVESNELNNSVTTGNFTVNAAPGVIITELGGNTNITEGGVTDSYSVVLNSKPTADVTININSGNQTSTNINSLTFTPNNWDVAQIVTLTAIDDTVIEGNHTQTISYSATSNDAKYNGISILPVTANITDNDVAVIPNVNLAVSTNTGTEAEQTVITVNAIASSAVSGTQTVNLSVSGTNITLVNDYTLSKTIITIPDGQTTGSVTFTVADDAVAEGSEAATLSISNPSSGITLGNTTTQNISITDNDIPGVIISKANTNVTESGATNNYTVVLATQPTAPVTVNITPSNNQINLGKGAGTAIFLDFTPNNWNILQTVTVAAVDDAEVEGNHNSSISHNAISKDSNYYLNLANIAVSIIDNDTEPTPNPEPIPAPNPEPILTPTPKPYSCGCEDLEKLINDSHNSKIPAHNPPHDFILASDDTDILFGGIGNDNIFGKSGDDLIFGNQDRDFINGNKGNDTIFGGKSNDFVRGGQNADLIFNDFGNDIACGDQGNDTVFGMIGDDILLGNTGDDFLNGNQGKDTVSGGEGNDVVRGGQDDDKLCGNTGSDTIFGDRGNDTICGCAGDDLIFGDEGNDTIGGGAGSDIFVLTSGTGSNTILDFMIAQDKLALTKGLNFQSLTITQGTGNRVNDSLIRIAATGELLASLIGVSANAIAANMFTTV